jgi:hypothetical protein
LPETPPKAPRISARVLKQQIELEGVLIVESAERRYSSARSGRYWLVCCVVQAAFVTGCRMDAKRRGVRLSF